MARPMRIRTDDFVMIMSGKDAGKTGRVSRTDPKRRRVYVENLNIIKRHERPRPVQDAQKAQQAQGGIVDKEGPIDVSNVMVLDPTDNKPTRIGVRRTEDGRRQRYSKRTGESLD